MVEKPASAAFQKFISIPQEQISAPGSGLKHKPWVN